LQAPLVLNVGATLRVVRSFSLGGFGLTYFVGGVSGSIITCGSLVILSSRKRTSTSVVVVVASPPSQTVTVPLIEFSTVSGSIVAVTSNVTNPDPCAGVDTVSSFSSSTLNVVLSPTSKCSLGAGAIASIAIGTIIGAALVIVAIVLVERIARNRHDVKQNRRLRGSEMQSMRSSETNLRLYDSLGTKNNIPQ
jgi:hypothetical protein